MRKNVRIVAAALAVSLGVAGLAGAQTPSLADAVKSRQANFKEIGASTKTIGDQLKTPAPDLAAIKPAAAKLKAHSLVLAAWFPVGSDASAGVKTTAKPEIWSDATGFAAAAQAFKDAAAKNDQLAQAGDIEGLKAHQRTMFGACGGCHTKYREKPQ